MAQLVPDTASVKMFLMGQAATDYAGAEAQVELYVRDTGLPGWTIAQLNLLRNYMRDWFNVGKNGGAAGKSLLTGDWFAIRFTARDLGASPGLVSTAPANIQGTRSGDAVPAGVSILIQYGMTGGGFPTEGRLFWPGGNNVDLTQNTWTDAYQTEVESRFTDFDADLSDPLNGGSVGWAQVRVSRSSGTVPDPTPRRIAVPRATALTNTIEALTTRDLYAIQRDRRPGE